MKIVLMTITVMVEGYELQDKVFLHTNCENLRFACNWHLANYYWGVKIDRRGCWWRYDTYVEAKLDSFQVVNENDIQILNKYFKITNETE